MIYHNLSEPLVSISEPSTSRFTPSSKTVLAILIGLVIFLSSVILYTSISSVSDPKLSELGFFLHDSPVQNFSISQNNQLLATSSESSITIWNIQNKLKLATFTYPGKVLDLAFSHQEQYIIASGDDKAVRVFSLGLYEEIAEFLHPSEVSHFKINPQTDSVITICEDNMLRIWDIRHKKVSNIVVIDDAGIAAFDINNPETDLVVATRSGRIEFWSLRSFNTRSYYLELFAGVKQLKMCSYSEEVVVQLDNDSLVLLSMETSMVDSIFSYKMKSSIVAMSEDVSYAVIGGETIEVVHIDSRKILAEFKHGSMVKCVAITPYGKHVISVSDDIMRVWSVDKGIEVASVRKPGNVKSMKMSEDYKLLATTAEDGYLRLYTFYD
jgi:WD40 repeat protein